MSRKFSKIIRGIISENEEKNQPEVDENIRQLMRMSFSKMSPYRKLEIVGKISLEYNKWRNNTSDQGIIRKNEIEKWAKRNDIIYKNGRLIYNAPSENQENIVTKPKGKNPIKEKRNELIRKKYHKLTDVEGKRPFTAMEELAKEFKLKKSTIRTIIYNSNY